MQKLINRRKIAAVMALLTTRKAASWLSRKVQWFFAHLPRITIYAYAFLYMYTGYDKLLHVEHFIRGNGRIPLIGRYAELIGWGIPILEILLAMLLVFSFGRMKRVTLRLSVSLMGIFTIYLGAMVLFVPDRLCHCGGVIESMKWTTHLIFNFFWLGAGAFSIAKSKKSFRDERDKTRL